LLQDLSAALDGRPAGGTLGFVFQPQVDLVTGELVSVESLLRWQHPLRGAVGPGTVVDVAESTALMVRITERAVDEVAAQLRRWNEAGHAVAAAVNVSMRDLHRDAFVDHVLTAAGREDLSTGQLTIEVTEGELISDERSVERVAARISDAGVGLSVDDFGTGFSSLQHLRRLPLTEIKIDKSLVERIVDDRDDRALVRSVLDLAATLRLRVVAEGVEDERTHRVLVDLGCPVAQGWHYGRPTTAAEISRRVSRERAAPQKRSRG
jgi:EAL domain-containing protein (putative c-di-GMP-specific phosphodiesterase class I)